MANYRLKGCTIRNISDSWTERFQTDTGDVMIERIHGRQWRVMPRGRGAFYVNGKQAAFEAACIADQKPPPRRGRRRR